MFKKLVSDIPFNPSLIEHIPEYRASLRKERKLRIIGLSILITAFLVQLFLVFFPSHSSLSNSPNDLVRGGFSSQGEAVRDCQNNVQDFRTILAYYDVSCNNLALAGTTSISSTDYNNQLYTLNRISYGYPTESVSTINRQNYWFRQLSAGSALSSANLKTLSGINDRGIKYFLIYSSGNLAFIGNPTISSACNPSTSLNCPKLSITARSGEINSANGITVKPNDTIIYTLSATNLSKQTVHDFVLGTNFSSALTYSYISNIYGGYIQKDNFLYWSATSIKAGQTITQNVTFMVDPSIAKTPLSSSDSNYYNMKMSTVYGNSVSIKVPWSFSKYFELRINNGYPSQSLLFSTTLSLILVLLVSYLLYRNVLILKELNNVKEDYLNGGRN